MTGKDDATSKPVLPFWRRALRWLIWGALSLILVPAILLTLALAWFDSDSGRAWLVSRINESGPLRIDQINGSFWSSFTVTGVRVETAEASVRVDHARMTWQPYSLLLRSLDVDSLEVGTVDYAAKPQPPAKQGTHAPESLSLPLAVQLQSFSLAQFRSANSPVFSSLEGSFSSTGREHQLNLKNIILPQGRISGVATLDGRQPFTLAGKLAFTGKIEGYEASGHAKAEGTLRNLALALQLDGQQLRASAGLTLDAFAEHGYQVVKAAQVELRGINPQALDAALPEARLDAHLRLSPQGAGRAVGDLAIENAQAGPLDEKRIPVKSINTQLEYINEALYLKRLHANTLGNGAIQGDAKLSNGALAVTLGLSSINPASIWSRQPQAALAGSLQLEGAWLAPDIRLDIRDQQRKVALKTDIGWINPKQERRIDIRELSLSQGNSELSAKGTFALEKNYDFNLDAEFRDLNPAAWLAVPAGQIAGKLKAKGRVQPDLQVALDYQLHNSRFNGSALAGEGRVSMQGSRVQQSDAWLALGSNKLSIKGALGRAEDQLHLELDLPALQQLGGGISGRVTGTVNLQGNWQTPRAKLQLDAMGLALPGGLEVGHANLSGSLQSDLNSPFDLTARLQGIAYGADRVEQLDLAINGTRSKHAGTVQASLTRAGSPARLEAAFGGSLGPNWVWQGQLAKLEGQWRYPFHLETPVNVTAGASQLQIGPVRLSYGQSRLAMEYFRQDGDNWETAGELPRIAVAEWLALMPMNELQGDLQLGAKWRLSFRNVLDGSITLARQQGDLSWRSSTPGSKAEHFRLGNSELTLRSDTSQLQLQGRISTAFGQTELAGKATFDPQTFIAPAAPLQLTLQGNIPDLAPLAALAGGDLKLNGQLLFDIKRTGTLNAADYSGHISGSKLSVSDPALGVQLMEGVVDIELAQRKILLNKLHFLGGKGSLDGSGLIALDAGDQLAASAQLKLDHFTLVSKADMLLVASGQGQIRVADGNLAISGAFRADQGDIRYVDNEVPKLSDDVVIAGRVPKQERALLKTALQLDLDLGKDFRVRGYGLDAVLTGQLRLRAQPGKPLNGSGTLSVEEGGQFRAYGQKLDIDRGILSFQGPLDNPGLDILAVRRNQQVEAGVKVTGSARSPRVSLYSEPTVSDTEKLSWLMFGHGSDSMDKSDSALLLQMLNSMAGDGLGRGLTDELLDKVGIDEVGYRTEKNEDGSSTQIISVSKQLSRNLRMSLEKSVDGLSDAVKLSFNLTRGWSLVTRIGFDKSSIDAYYTVSFD